MKNNTFHKIIAVEFLLLALLFIGIAALMAKPAQSKKGNIIAKSAQPQKSDIMQDVYVQLPNGKLAPYTKVRIKVERDKRGRQVIIIIPEECPKNKEELKRLVDKVAEELHYQNKRHAHRIIKCESDYEPGAYGPTHDYGLWQIVPAFNRGVSKECALDPYCSTRWAINELKQGNDWKWNASRHCWGK